MRGQVPVSVAVDPNTVVSKAQNHFEGLSYESGLLAPNDQGGYYFDPTNKTLVAIFKTLGVQNLRVGGATVDEEKTEPGIPAIDALYHFAAAANVKVIYTFRMKNADAAEIATAASDAKYILTHYRDRVNCFAIGNEPNVYLSPYAKFAAAWVPYYKALEAQCPDIPICGPGSYQEGYAVSFSRQFSGNKNLKMVTQHEYPLGNGKTSRDATKNRAKMLSVNGYANLYGRFVPAVLEQHLPYRLEETNSYCIGGAPAASNAYTAALWGLDYLYWWWAHQASGVDFHTGSHNPNFGRVASYSAFAPANGGQDAWPLAYGMLAFHEGAQGALVEAKTSLQSGVTPAFNLSAYAVADGKGSVFVTIINRDNGANARQADVTITLPKAVMATSVQECGLRAPGGDIASQEGVTLGGAGIQPDGSWTGTWTPITDAAHGDTVSVSVPAASADVIKIGYR